jgi:aspartyl aminopeptidase
MFSRRNSVVRRYSSGSPINEHWLSLNLGFSGVILFLNVGGPNHTNKKAENCDNEDDVASDRGRA